MKRERMKNDVDKTWQPGEGDGITKLSTSAGMLTWCHNLDIEKVVPQSRPKMKGGATK